MAERRIISESDAERIIDRRVMRALGRDVAYVNAENADEQQAAEYAIDERITRAVYAEFDVQR